MDKLSERGDRTYRESSSGFKGRSSPIIIHRTVGEGRSGREGFPWTKACGNHAGTDHAVQSPDTSFGILNSAPESLCQ